MKSYRAKELDEQLIYKLLSGSVVPRPIAWLTTQNEEGLVNVAPFSFFNVASANPPLLSVAFTGEKDSYLNLRTTKEAVIHLINSDNVVLMNQTAAKLAANESEAEKFALDLEPSQIVNVPSLVKSRVRFETQLYQDISLGQEGHLVLLEVVSLSFTDEVIDTEKFYIDVEALGPIARLAGNDYAKLGESFKIERPH
ncbi:flavin reductase family protein [Lactococcus taiwanensis]|uniref:Flavin reductase family protein n=1 Tax=Lactococcus taiwanensis TaxID=1151742 RepID=A0AA45KIS2_9LACT|nr:flavin reductase family protein [Lactococcus taiwanensis]QSE76941.1 flavin reductase family protein [Lactococcus taiwanensis]